MQADISHGDYETYMPDLMEKFSAISKEEVLQRVAALEFDHFLKYYENAEDLNAPSRKDFSRKQEMPATRSGQNRNNFNRRDNGYTRLFVNLGTKDGFYKASFLQFILDESNLSKDILGKIDIREMNTWVEVDQSAAGKLIKSFDGRKFQGRTIRMNEADGGFKRAGNDERKRPSFNRNR